MIKSKIERIKIGVLIEVIGNMYKVVIEDDIIDCTMSTKVKKRYKKVSSIGDKIQIEISPYDDTRGRIEPRGFIY